MIIGNLKFEPYFEVLYPLEVVNSLSVSLFVFSYHQLPIAIIDLMGDNREFEV